MPEMKQYIVSQTREVSVTANNEVDAIRIADAALTHGQDANGGIAKDKAPEGVWGNTDARIEVTDLSIERRRF